MYFNSHCRTCEFLCRDGNGRNYCGTYSLGTEECCELDGFLSYIKRRTKKVVTRRERRKYKGNPNDFLMRMYAAKMKKKDLLSALRKQGVLDINNMSVGLIYLIHKDECEGVLSVWKNGGNRK